MLLKYSTSYFCSLGAGSYYLYVLLGILGAVHRWSGWEVRQSCCLWHWKWFLLTDKDNISPSLHSGICVVLYLSLMCWTHTHTQNNQLSGWVWLALPPLGKRKMLPFKRIIWTDEDYFTALQYKAISSADKLVFLWIFLTLCLPKPRIFKKANPQLPAPPLILCSLLLPLVIISFRPLPKDLCVFSC